jgi:RNA polymerase sigma factor (sigma-70 family)
MSNEINDESFTGGFHKAFGHADDPPVAYEQLRLKLIYFFLCHGHNLDAEDLADEVINRLLQKLSDGTEQIKDVVKFAFGVARNVNWEQRRRKQGKLSELSLDSDFGELPQKVSFEQEDSFDKERYFEALERCLEQLKPKERKLLTEYYVVRRGETKILARELGLSHNNLRIRVFRIKQRVKEMMNQYLNS